MKSHSFQDGFQGVILIVLCAFLFAPGDNLSAQEYKIGNGNLGLHFMLIFPRGEFEKELDAFGIGGNLDLSGFLGNLPLATGLQFGYAFYGWNTFRVPFSQFARIVDVEVTTTNNILLGHAFLRIQPRGGDFRPYFEGLLGFGYFWTRTSVENQSTGEEIAGSIKKNDIAFSYGGGGGIAFRVYSGFPDDIHPTDILADIRLRYMYGGEAVFYRADAVYKDENQTIQFDQSKLRRAKTDILTVLLGVTIRY